MPIKAIYNPSQSGKTSVCGLGIAKKIVKMPKMLLSQKKHSAFFKHLSSKLAGGEVEKAQMLNPVPILPWLALLYGCHRWTDKSERSACANSASLNERSASPWNIMQNWCGVRAKTAIITVFIGFFVLFPNTSPAQAGFLSNLFEFFGYSSKKAVEERAQPFFIKETLASVSIPALDSTPNPPLEGKGGLREDIGLTVVQNSALAAPLNPVGVIADEFAAGQIFIYTVKPGDNPSQIAKSFGVSLNTLLWANNLTDPRAIRPGDKLLVLPISGVQVEVKKNDTIDSIAKKYRGNIEDILAFNGLSPDGPPLVGSTLIIPDGEFDWTPNYLGPSRHQAEINRYPSYDGYYLRPIDGGRKSRGIHGYNGIDLANTCGLPVLASAGGTVIIARPQGWNGGYGRYLAITHPNGTQTLYAHLKEVSAAVGQNISQGQPIGTIGSSGNSTGCHVHFEVRGAKNPF